MKQFICSDCNKRFRFANKPKFCPYCGSSHVSHDNGKAAENAKQKIEELNQLIVELNAARDIYCEAYAKYESVRRTLLTYADRGVIAKKDIPTADQKKLIDALYDYRRQRKVAKEKA